MSKNPNEDLLRASHKYLSGSWLGRDDDLFYLHPLKMQGAFSQTQPTDFICVGRRGDIVDAWRQMGLDIREFNHSLCIGSNAQSIPCHIIDDRGDTAVIELCESMYIDPNTGDIGVWLENPLAISSYEANKKDTPILARKAWLTPALAKKINDDLRTPQFKCDWIYQPQINNARLEYSLDGVLVETFNEPDPETKIREESRMDAFLMVFRPEQEMIRIDVTAPDVLTKIKARGSIPGRVDVAAWDGAALIQKTVGAAIASVYKEQMTGVDYHDWTVNGLFTIERTKNDRENDHWKQSYVLELSSGLPVNEKVMQRISDMLPLDLPEMVHLSTITHIPSRHTVLESQTWLKPLTDFVRANLSEHLKMSVLDLTRRLTELGFSMLDENSTLSSRDVGTITEKILDLQKKDMLTIESLVNMHHDFCLTRAATRYSGQLPSLDADPSLDNNIHRDASTPTLKIQ